MKIDIRGQKRRCELSDFLLDLLDFIEEQVLLAKQDANDQSTAIQVASGAIPLFKSRLGEREAVRSMVMLVLSEQVGDLWWRNWWDKFGAGSREEFIEQAADLTHRIGVLKGQLRTLSL